MLVERRGLSGRAEGEHAVDPAVDHVLHKTGQAAFVDLAFPCHGRSKRDEDTRKTVELEHRAQPNAA